VARKWSELKGARRKFRRVRYALPALLRDMWRPFSRAWYWVRTHTYNRYHLVDCRDARNGYEWGWIDRDQLMLFACFQILREFVEKEDPRVGLRTIEDFAGGSNFDDERKMLEDQLAREREVRALYDWWTKGRAEERELADRMVDELRPKGWSFHHDEKWDAWSKMHEYVERKDNEMLDRLMKIRECLWT
jgi:hypothetical protein